jgi:hypothetical protein
MHGTGLVLSLAILAMSAGCATGPEKTAEENRVLALVNRGVALMGQFEYDAAIETFEQAALLEPASSVIAVNLAIAVLNRQNDGDEQRAVDILNEVVAGDAVQLRAQYCLALLELRRGESEPATERLLQVADRDPDDADAAYWVGQSLLAQDRAEEAAIWFERAAEIDPYLRSAFYGAFQAQQRLGNRIEGMEHLERFRSLAENPRARLAEYKYTRMGSKAAATPLKRAIVATSKESPSGPVFSNLKRLGAHVPWRMDAEFVVPSVCDLNNDCMSDLFLPAAVESDCSIGNAILLGNDHGAFDFVGDHPLSSVTGTRTVLWGDFDNDGLTDAYLCRRGPNQLWRQVSTGEWSEVTDSTRTSGGEVDTIDGALWDADHDGDLDVFLVNANGPNDLLSNNGDGSFRPLAQKHGVAGVGDGSHRVVVADLDGDRDTDIIVVNNDGPHEVYRNDLLWQWLPAEGFDAFRESPAAEVVAADIDADGRVEIVSLERDGGIRLWERTQSVWQAKDLARVDGMAVNPQLAVSDVDGDGLLELLVTTDDGWQVLELDGSEIERIVEPRLSGWTLAALDNQRGPSLVGWTQERGPMIWSPGPGRWPFVSLTLSGREDRAESMRSNASGIGSRIVARVGSRWTVLEGIRCLSGPGQSLQPIQIGLGGAKHVDYIEIHWSDAVYQTEIDLVPSQIHHITETQRQLSSCPVLFAWNGEEWAFVTDLLGVGGMGYAVAPGEYAPPRPWENILFSPGLLVPRDGRLAVKLAEPMEEAAYIDSARLVAWDLPPGWSMALDERMGINGPQPTGKPFFFRKEMKAVAAHDSLGSAVTDLVAEADLRAPDVGRVDRRYIGLLENEQTLELEFPKSLDQLGDQLALVVDGWVEYPYSQTNFAAWQAGLTYQAPTLEARGADGVWHVVLEQFGYPAGMPRQMAVPLPALPLGTRELRLRTNQEVYWDRVAVVVVEQCPEAIRRELNLTEASLATTGYARRTTGGQRVPDYDYARRAPLWDSKVQDGWYTSFGQVEELVEKADDALVIFGPGEEIHLEFHAPELPPASGWTRRFLLETEGWCKDMDLYTKDGATVGPIPSAGRSTDASRRLHAAHTTRYRCGLE